MNFFKKIKNLNLSKRDLWITLSTLVVLVIAFAIFQNTPVSTARALDIRFGFYAIFLTFILLCVAAVWNAPEFFKRLKKIKPNSSIIAVGTVVLVLFSVFIFSNISNTHRVLSDETSWESMALQMEFKRSGGICNEGIWENGVLNCVTEVNNFKGKSLGLLESFAYTLFGSGRDTALQVNFPLYLLSLIAFFLALSVWFKNEHLALAAAVFLGGMPILMMQSRSASTEVLYIFLLSCLMLWYALVPAKEVKWKHFALTVPLLGLFAQTRQETVFAFIPFALYYVTYFREKCYRLPLFVAAVIAVSWPSINTMAAYRGYDFQGGEHAAHSFANFWFNLKSNIVIMLNLEGDSAFGGILANPFYTTFTILLFVTTLWLIGCVIFKKRYIRGSVLGILFCLQIFVILFNVSGTFEIDINQRYVLVALPLFALLMALGLFDMVRTFTKWTPKQAGLAIAGLSVILTFGLAFYHTSSFRANMMYYKNKLLGEEDFLNTKLAHFPENSVFIYARPWQMLASGHSSFSERTFLGWNNEKFAEWMAKTNGNIYVVRGQDGRGRVNRKSRVVGFKTTTEIEKIFQDFKTENVIIEKRKFGYPLSVDKIIAKRGVSDYLQKLSLSEMENGKFILKKLFPESIVCRLTWNEKQQEEIIVDSSQFAIHLDSATIRRGMNRGLLNCALPDGDTVFFYRDYFLSTEKTLLLSELPLAAYEQAWGDPQRNTSVEHNLLSIGKTVFRYGIGSHAPSHLTWKLPPPFNTKPFEFYATIGLDDESVCGDGASFIIRADGKEVYRSLRLYTEDRENVKLHLNSISVLELLAEAGDNKDCDHADWANVWLSAE